MIAFNLSQDRPTKARLRAASLNLASRVLREGGFVEASVYVSQMAPSAVRVLSRSQLRLPSSIAAFLPDSDTVVRSTRRSSLRYAAILLRSRGMHEDASLHLDRVADSVPAEVRLPRSRTVRRA